MPEHLPRTVLVSTPSMEGYGSDLQMLQSVAGLREAGWRVVVATNGQGRLSPRVSALGGEVTELDFPVLRRASASGAGMAALAATATRAVPRLAATLRRARADVLYVNTLTLPWWLAAGRLARVPVVCHVHEAEVRDSRTVRRALTLPLLLAQGVIANSQTTEATLVDVVPRLRSRISRVCNGVEAPTTPPGPRQAGQHVRLVVVGRLSPRKAPDTALEATALLRSRGHDVRLEVCGTAVEGMEWFRDQLVERSRQADLEGAVTFTGYAAPVWPVLERADVVIAPSLGESFGNAVVEGQLAERPVVATALQGHLETITDGETGLLVPAQDAAALATAVERLLRDPDLARQIARQGRRSALQNFSVGRYRREICAVLEQVSDGGVDQFVGRSR